MFNEEDILEVAQEEKCDWAIWCQCGHLKLDHDDAVGCLANGISKSPDDPPPFEDGSGELICRCIEFRPVTPG